MDKPTPPESTWYERIFERLDAGPMPANLSAFCDADYVPAWVRNVLQELLQQSHPAISLKKFGAVTPEKLGILLGQQCANAFAMGENFSQPQADPKAVEAAMERLKQNQHLPAVNRLLGALRLLEGLGSHLSARIQWLEMLSNDACKEALAQSSHEEASAFFRGFSKGIARKGMDKFSPVRSTTATEIYQKLFCCWGEVSQLKSVSELRSLLIQTGVKEQMLRDPKRLEKICERIGLKLRGRGRPRKSDKPPR